MNKKEIMELINSIRTQIEKANYDYHTLDTPTISDYEYDHLFAQLVELEEQYPEFQDPSSPTNKIGGEVLSGFTKVAHQTPMMSLSDVFNADELATFFARAQKNLPDFQIISELKIDGLAINLTYENGKLLQASTRGDGLIGEDVTNNVLTIKSIPLVLREPVNIQVRGEIYLPLPAFNRLNEERTQQNLPLFANARNAAAGTLRQLDPKVVAQRGLSSFLYTLTNYGDFQVTSQEEALQLMAKLGFKVNPHYQLQPVSPDWESVIQHYDELRKTLPYDTDGIVLKVNNFAYHDEIGVTAKAPKWAVAYKFPPQVVETIVREVVWQVGRTGMLTPVANLDPVAVSGSIVRRATLHNQDFIQSKDLRIGDTVRLQKAAEIIPEIIEVNLQKRPEGTVALTIPLVCPICQTPLNKDENKVDSFCPNQNCPARAVNQLIHYASRKAVDIDTLGEQVIEQLYNNALLSDITSIYLLKDHIAEMQELDGFQIKKINNLLNAIQDRMTIPLPKFLFGLGIKHVGEKVAKSLAGYFHTLHHIMNASALTIQAYPDFGPEIAKEVEAYFQNPVNQAMLSALFDLGITILEQGDSLQIDQFWHGKKIVITGSFSLFRRDELASQLEEYGAKVSSSVSKKTDYLLCGSDPGSKLTKAQELGVTVLDETQLQEILTK